MVSRRSFLRRFAESAAIVAPISLHGSQLWAAPVPAATAIPTPFAEEDIFSFIRRLRGGHDPVLYAQILGSANEFKEGDAIVGVAAADATSRHNARALLAKTRLAAIDAHPLHPDDLFGYISAASSPAALPRVQEQTLEEFKEFLLTSDEAEIKQVMPGLSSDVISCVVKLLSNAELIEIGQKIFNPLPGSQIGAKGYLGARVQPNSPTDNVEDIRWQVFDAWCYAVGDVLLGTNPVSSEPESVVAIEQALQELLTTFEINHLLPHCVLAHIDVQAEVERRWPGSTELWFQSIAGSDTANQTFDIDLEKMQRYADSRSGPYGLYFETGQGADFTNGHSHGFDMVMHESRKYGFARALSARVELTRSDTGSPGIPWVHLNDVAGFIGPEVFRTREQLVRCCLEDIVMGKLHGLCIGLDVCSTLHMDISLTDLDWCLDQILPANPAYLMALPTKIDPMLGYLTTGYQDHVRLRERYGYRVNDAMWQFFQELGVVDQGGQPTEHFGDPLWVYLGYRRRKGDQRKDSDILQEGQRQLAEVRARGLFVAEGHGTKPWDLKPALQSQIDSIYDDAKLSIWAELKPEFIAAIPDRLQLATRSENRSDYILHPTTGEQLSERAVATLGQLRQNQAGEFNVQIVISDGLNALAIMQDEQLFPFLNRLRSGLEDEGLRIAPDNLVITFGRVRAGYHVGEILFAGLAGPHAILHIIGERPGTGHRTYSIYITAPDGNLWASKGSVDHNITKVVSGVATTALEPTKAAEQVLRLLRTII